MHLPPRPSAGSRMSANTVARTIDEVRYRTVNGGGVGLVQHRANGVVISRRPTGLQPAPRRWGGLHPFRVYNRSLGGDTPEARIGVRPGIVNALVPTLGGNPLDDDPIPYLAVVTGVVYLETTGDETTGVVSIAAVKNAATLPEETTTMGIQLLANVVVTSSRVTSITNFVEHSLKVRRCGVNDWHFWGV